MILGSIKNCNKYHGEGGQWSAAYDGVSLDTWHTTKGLVQDPHPQVSASCQTQWQNIGLAFQ